MITLIAGTNNKNSHTEKLARIYFQALLDAKVEVNYLSLTSLNLYVINEDMYDNNDKEISRIGDNYFLNSDKLLFVVPEYNGSFPGILKLLIDAMDVKKYLYFKKAAIVGVATGRAGNLRGIDHLTSILQHTKITVMPHILPVSSVHLEIDEALEFKNQRTKMALQHHLKQFLAF